MPPRCCNWLRSTVRNRMTMSRCSRRLVNQSLTWGVLCQLLSKASAWQEMSQSHWDSGALRKMGSYCRTPSRLVDHTTPFSPSLAPYFFLQLLFWHLYSKCEWPDCLKRSLSLPGSPTERWRHRTCLGQRLCGPDVQRHSLEVLEIKQAVPGRQMALPDCHQKSGFSKVEHQTFNIDLIESY
jgi:hypothetical protein